MSEKASNLTLQSSITTTTPEHIFATALRRLFAMGVGDWGAGIGEEKRGVRTSGSITLQS